MGKQKKQREKHEIHGSGKQSDSSQVSKTKSSLVAELTEISWKGPLPPPVVIEHYERILPGAAERIFALLEKQTNHRIQMEKRELTSDNSRSWGGMILGTTVVLSLIGGSIWLISNGYGIEGTILAGADLGAVLSAYIYGQRQKGNIPPSQ